MAAKDFPPFEEIQVSLMVVQARGFTEEQWESVLQALHRTTIMALALYHKDTGGRLDGRRSWYEDLVKTQPYSDWMYQMCEFLALDQASWDKVAKILERDYPDAFPTGN